MNLQRLEFTFTTKCNSQCIHCQADASPLRNDVMDVKHAHNYLEEATAVSNIESFMVFGGEPMLYPREVIVVFKRAYQLGIPRIEMITNGVWGKDRETAEELAAKLKEAGLNKVNISVDAFHVRYIPLEYPKNSALALLKAGIEDVKWNVAVVESTDAENEYDEKTKELLKELEPIGLEANIVKIMPMGRAVQNLSEFFPHTPLEGPCEGEPIIGNPLTDPESICVEPSGAVNVCWNLVIGNARETPLSQIISEYDWQRNPIIKTLVEEGPTGFLKRLKARGHRFQKDTYVNKCHLCVEIRKTLSNSLLKVL